MRRLVYSSSCSVYGIPDVLPVRLQPRRPGDPPMLVASVERSARELGWKPRRSDLQIIVASAWTWHSGHPDGYAK